MVVAPQPPAPEVPFGSTAPEARITAVATAATGTPVALGNIVVPFRVTTLVARGPGNWNPGSDARIELVFTGTHRATFSRPLEHPAPAIIAHVFSVPLAAQSPDGLEPGLYEMRVRLVMRDSAAIASSVPLSIVVR